MSGLPVFHLETALFKYPRSVASMPLSLLFRDRGEHRDWQYFTFYLLWIDYILRSIVLYEQQQRLKWSQDHDDYYNL